MPKSLPHLLRPTYIRHPAIADDAGAFVTLRVDTAKILKSWRGSLFSFEWLKPDGTLKTPDELGAVQQTARADVEQRLVAGQSVARPVLGIGLLDCVEIGGGREVLLTLAALGVDSIEVDIPTLMTKDFQKFLARDSQHGGALIYVLLAMVLIAALSYTVMRTSNSGGAAHLSTGRATIIADELLTIGDAVKNAVARLQLRGCTETQLSFQNDVVAGYTNGTAPVDGSCSLFNPAGGAITFTTPTTDANDGSAWLFAGGPVMHNQGGYASTFTAGNADLVMLLFNVHPAVCAQINDKLGIGGVPVDDGEYTNMTKFQGVYAGTENVNGVNAASSPSPCIGGAAPAPNLCGRETGCFVEEDGAQRHIYYQVLLQR